MYKKVIFKEKRVKPALPKTNLGKRKGANMTPQEKPLLENKPVVYVGIDAHRLSWSFTVLKADEVIERKTIRADWVQLVRFIGKYQGYKIVSAYEAGYCGFGLHYQLTELGVENIVVAANKMPVVRGDQVKTDRRDSLKLATFLAKGLLKPIYVPSRELIQVREIIRLRDTLVSKRTATINQFKAILVKNSLDLDFEGYEKKIIEGFLESEMIPDLVRPALLVHAQKMHLYTEQIKLMERQAEEVALSENYKSIYQRIRSVPGIGAVAGKVLLFEIGDFKRFKNERKIAAYCGLTPAEYSSGDRVVRGRITGQGQEYLRRLLIQASWQAIKVDEGINEFYERMVKNTGNKKKAIVAVARKLLCIVLSVVKQERFYQSRAA